MDRVYVVIPYLKTSGPVSVRGINLVSSEALEQLAEDARTHLRTLCSMFYLRDEFRIRSMTCGVVDVKALIKEGIDPDRRFWEVRTLLGFLHGTPGRKPADPWLRAEHATVFRFLDKPVSHFAIWPRDGVVGPLPDREPMDVSDSYVAGYEGWTDSDGYLHVVPTSRIYPPASGMWLNIYQDLSAQLGEAHERSARHGVLTLLTGESFLPEDVEARAFLSMDWYNRSTAIASDEKAALMSMAIAFETLLSVEETEQKAVGMARGIQALLGPIQRLDSWAYQFYKARSAIVHEGDCSSLGFLAVDREKVPRVLKREVEGNRYRRLSDYGRLLFRLCLDTLLFGASRTESHQLNEVFRHNQERLQEICKLLGGPEVRPERTLSQVGAQVIALEKYWLESEDLVELETLFATGRLMLRRSLNAPGTEWTPSVRATIERILDEKAALDNEALVWQWKVLAEQLENLVGRRNLTTGPRVLSNWPEVVLEFARYASGPSFALKAYSKDKTRRQAEDASQTGLRPTRRPEDPR